MSEGRRVARVAEIGARTRKAEPDVVEAMSRRNPSEGDGLDPQRLMRVIREAVRVDRAKG